MHCIQTAAAAAAPSVLRCRRCRRRRHAGTATAGCDAGPAALARAFCRPPALPVAPPAAAQLTLNGLLGSAEAQAHVLVPPLATLTDNLQGGLVVAAAEGRAAARRMSTDSMPTAQSEAAPALLCCRAPGMPSVPARGGRSLGCLPRCQASTHAVHTAQHRCTARCAPPQALHGFWHLLTRAARPAAAGTPSRSADNKGKAVRAAARGPAPSQRCSDGPARSPGQPWRRLKGPLTLSSRKRAKAAPQGPQMGQAAVSPVATVPGEAGTDPPDLHFVPQAGYFRAFDIVLKHCSPARSPLGAHMLHL